MLTKKEMLRKITAVKFAIHDTELFLDSHPQNIKAVELLSAYRKELSDLINDYEQKYGDYVTRVGDVSAEVPWSWLDGPWPWEVTEGDN